MPYTFKPSPHKSSRQGCTISAIILHFTAGATLAGTLRWFANPKARVSAHYVVGRDGQVVQMVQEHEKAWHAGVASLEGDPRVNSVSIGIELVNWGELKKSGELDFYCWPEEFTRRYDIDKFGMPEAFDKYVDGKLTRTYWAPYPEAQLSAVIKLCQEIAQRYQDITPERILGHEDVSPTRKNDPGPALDIGRIRREAFVLHDELYSDSAGEDEVPEDELSKRQGDRAEPLGWVSGLLAFLKRMRSRHAS